MEYGLWRLASDVILGWTGTTVLDFEIVNEVNEFRIQQSLQLGVE